MEFCGELVVAAADDDELNGDTRGVKPLRDVIHYPRAESSEKKDARWPIRFQPEPPAKSHRVRVIG